MEAVTARGLARARQLVELGRWPEAKDELGAVVAAAPESTEALCLLAQAHLALDERTPAARAAEAARRLSPGDEWPHRLHALALITMDRHREAVDAAGEAVRSAPWLAESHRVMAAALMGLPGRADAARAAADRALELAPHSAAAHVAVGRAAGHQGRVREERDAYRRALELDPGNATAMNNLAAIDVGRGRLAGASRFLTGALRADPHQFEARANLDVVVTQLVRRITVVGVFGGLVVALMAAAGPDGGAGAPWWGRALAGTAVLALMALAAWHTLRHLPAGTRRHLRGWPRRIRGYDRLVAAVFCVSLVTLLGAAFLPGDAAEAAGAGVFVAFRVVWVMGVIGIIQALRRRRGA